MKPFLTFNLHPLIMSYVCMYIDNHQQWIVSMHGCHQCIQWIVSMAATSASTIPPFGNTFAPCYFDHDEYGNYLIVHYVILTPLLA
jgi:hypothetical protein